MAPEAVRGTITLGYFLRGLERLLHTRERNHRLHHQQHFGGPLEVGPLEHWRNQLSCVFTMEIELMLHTVIELPARV